SFLSARVLRFALLATADGGRRWRQQRELRAHGLHERLPIAREPARLFELGERLGLLGRELERGARVNERAGTIDQAVAGELDQLLQQGALRLRIFLGAQAQLVERRQPRPLLL